MKLMILSDLHLEFTPWSPPAEAVVAADLIILAGDIAKGSAGIVWARESFPDKAILYVSGNHEYYDGTLDETLTSIRSEARRSEITLLENGTVETGGVRFLGCTLWTDFNLFGGRIPALEAQAAAAKSMLDFSRIHSRDGQFLTPGDTVALNQNSSTWLRRQLEKTFSGATVVITHHAPSIRSVAPRWASDPVSAGFAGDCEDLVGMATLWIHGHTHTAFDYRIGMDPARGRVICNPRGYRRVDGSGEQTGFDPGLLIEV